MMTRSMRGLLLGWLVMSSGCSTAVNPIELSTLYLDYAAFDGRDLQVRGVVSSDMEGFALTLPVPGQASGYPMMIRFEDTAAQSEEGRNFFELLRKERGAEALLEGRFHGRSQEEALQTLDGPRRFVFDVTKIAGVRQVQTPER